VGQARTNANATSSRSASTSPTSKRSKAGTRGHRQELQRPYGDRVVDVARVDPSTLTKGRARSVRSFRWRDNPPDVGRVRCLILDCRGVIPAPRRANARSAKIVLVRGKRRGADDSRRAIQRRQRRFPNAVRSRVDCESMSARASDFSWPSRTGGCKRRRRPTDADCRTFRGRVTVKGRVMKTPE